jgi:hypothetical protein
MEPPESAGFISILNNTSHRQRQEPVELVVIGLRFISEAGTQAIFGQSHGVKDPSSGRSGCPRSLSGRLPNNPIRALALAQNDLVPAVAV